MTRGDGGAELRIVCHPGLYGGAQRRQALGREPRVLLEPAVVVPRRMRRGKISRRVVTPRPHRFGQVFLALHAQMVGLGICSSENEQLKARQRREQALVPVRRTFWARRLVAVGPSAWIAKALRDDGDAALVIERIRGEAEPIPQTIAGGVVPGHAAFVHPRARRLAHDHHPRRYARPQHRPWPQWEFGFADSAGPHFGEEGGERVQSWSDLVHAIPDMAFGIAEQYRAPALAPLRPNENRARGSRGVSYGRGRRRASHRPCPAASGSGLRRR